MSHLRCTSWAVVAALIGVAATAWGQEAEHIATSDPVAGATSDMILHLISGGGLPAILAAIAWWARGALGTGIPIVVRLDPESLTAIRRSIRRGIEHADTESDDSDDPSPTSGR